MKVEAYQDTVGKIHATRKGSNIASVIHVLDIDDSYDLDETMQRDLAETVLSKIPELIKIERDKS